MEYPLVSIKCLVYNHEPYLRQCLDGFVMQKTNFAFEVIVHDDASIDNSVEIIREYAEKYPDIIKPIYEKENQYSKNDGSIQKIMKKAIHPCVKYIAICEGDDYWIDSYKLQKQIDFLERNQEYSLVYTSAMIFNQETSCFEKSILGSGYNKQSDIFINNRIPTLTTIFRKDIFEKYTQEIQLRWKMGDYPLWIFISQNAKIHFMNEITAVYRLLRNSASSRSSYEKRKSFIMSSCEMRKYMAKYFNYNIHDIELINNRELFDLAYNNAIYKDVIYYYSRIEKKDFKRIIKYILSVLFTLIK